MTDDQFWAISISLIIIALQVSACLGILIGMLLGKERD